MNSIEPGEPPELLEPAEPRERQVALPEPAIPSPAHCKNCNAVLLGRFCANCSQAADVHVPSTMELVHDLLEGLTHSDSRLWRTLKFLWFKPGRLTQDFVAGRRAAYLPPFRLYLILSIVFFLIASLTHIPGEVIRFDDASKPAGVAGAPRVTGCQDLKFDIFSGQPQLAQRVQHACQEMVRDNGENLLHIAVGTMSKAMFIFLPLIAFLHMLLYWRPRYRYAEHLLFFVHLHAFYFSVAIVMVCASNAAESWPKVSGVSDILETVLGWCLPIYTLLAMRRVFQRSWAGTLFKAVILFFVYSIVFGLTVASVVVYAAWQL
ncbi:MAG: hypothetical protein QOG17_2492 [Gammaproteobacteria bacterium]|nr:hypothetical protein [Gammaproteobacteria bacterium]